MLLESCLHVQREYIRICKTVKFAPGKLHTRARALTYMHACAHTHRQILKKKEKTYRFFLLHKNTWTAKVAYHTQYPTQKGLSEPALLESKGYVNY